MKKKPFLLFDVFRLFAIGLVLLYHFFSQSLPGGLIGVDLFASLSGFLITGLFLDAIAGHDGTKKPTLLSFWKHRFSRILPTLIVMVLLVLPLPIFFSADFRVGLMRQAAAAVGFVTNLFEMQTGGSYESRFVKHLFLHTWTLSIEMHFYLFWGLVLFLCHRVLIRWHPKDCPQAQDTRLRLGVLVLSGVLWLISLLLMVIRAIRGVETATLYFSDGTRAFPYFAGAFLAALFGMQEHTVLLQALRRKVPSALPLLLSVAFAWGIVAMAKWGRYEEVHLYLWMLPLLSLLTVGLLGSFRLIHAKWTLPEMPILHAVASRSYGLYLFHWPLFVLFESVFPKGAAVIASLVLGVALTIFSEGLVRFLRKQKSFRSWSLRIAFAIGGGFLFLGVMGEATAPKLVSLERDLWQESLKQGFSNARQKAQNLRSDLEKERQEKVKGIREAGVTIIGDSVTLGIREDLLEHLENSIVDGKVSRFLHEAPDVLREYKAQGELRPTVIVALGINIYPNYRDTVQELLDLLPDGDRLIFVTPSTADAKEGDDITGYTQYLRELEGKIAYLTIADWTKIAQQHPEIYRGTDGTHFMGNEEGTRLFLQMIDDALSDSASQPAKGESAK